MVLLFGACVGSLEKGWRPQVIVRGWPRGSRVATEWQPRGSRGTARCTWRYYRQVCSVLVFLSRTALSCQQVLPSNRSVVVVQVFHIQGLGVACASDSIGQEVAGGGWLCVQTTSYAETYCTYSSTVCFVRRLLYLLRFFGQRALFHKTFVNIPF